MTPERILTFTLSLVVAFLIVTTVYDWLVIPAYNKLAVAGATMQQESKS